MLKAIQFFTIISFIACISSIITFKLMLVEFKTDHAVVIIPHTDGNFVLHDSDLERAKHDNDKRRQRTMLGKANLRGKSQAKEIQG